MNYFKRICLALLVISTSSLAQIEVNSSGNVGMNDGEAMTDRGVYIKYDYYSSPNTYGLVVRKEAAAGTSAKASGTYSFIYGGIGYDYGLKGGAYRSTANSQGRAYGVYGFAGNHTSGYNYGVYGTTYGTNNAAGIFGTTASNGDCSVDGTYAGYFNGNVKITGTLWCSSIDQSDERFKENIFSLNDRFNSLDKITQLQPVTYNLKSIKPYQTNVKSDTITPQTQTPIELLEREHLGFIAQDLEKVFPNMVYEDESGYKGIKYTELIPVLVDAIKLQQKEIESLKSSLNIQNKSSIIFDEEVDNGNNKTILHQNNPNPFNESTIIKFKIADDVINAQLYIFDLQGSMLKLFKLNSQDSNEVYIKSNTLSAGMYIYTLVCDGKEIDSKRMIIN